MRGEAHGRVNLIGEHTDYNDGLVLPAPIPQRVVVELVPRDDERVSAASDRFDGGRPATYRLGEERPRHSWLDHVQGLTWVLRVEGQPLGGFDARVRSDLPVGAGLASSAALAVAVLRALRDAFSLAFDDVRLARLAHRAEVEFVGAHVGLMDQLVASLGREGEALRIDLRDLSTEPIPLPLHAELAVIDSGVRHEHASGGYNARRAECKEAARALGLASLRDAHLADADRLPEPLSRRVRHVVSENARVEAAADALREGDLHRLGHLLNLSHASLRDDFEVGTPELDLLARLVRREPEVFGARLVGGGFGGAILALCARGHARPAAESAAAAYGLETGLRAAVLLPNS